MATTKYTIRKGESLIMEIPVIDTDGQAVDISTAATTNILVTLSKKNVVFAKYSLTDMGVGWGDLDRTTNIIQILATRTETKLWDSGYGSATITVEQDEAVLTHKVEDFEVSDFVQILTSANAEYTLIH